MHLAGCTRFVAEPLTQTAGKRPISTLTLPYQHFILVFCLSATPACLYLPEFSVRSLACQTRFQPETLGYAGSSCALGS